jgi:hypothetical protein
MNWNHAGEVNTDETIDVTIARALELGVRHLVVATCSGANIRKVLERNTDLNIIGVTHHVGFDGPGVDEMTESVRSELQAQGVKLLTTTHLLAGVDRAVRVQFGGLYPAEIIAQSLRLFGQGIKVAVEIAVMALDAGLIPYGEEVISIGGTAAGADASLVICPAHSNKFFQTEVREIICMPRNKGIMR